jgi:hypothetical protein
MGSIKKYWLGDARVQLPRLLDERLGIDAHVQTYDFLEELFFGIGPDSLRSDLVSYGLRNTIVGTTASVRPTSWLTVSGGADFLNPAISSTTESDSIGSRFDDASAPGLAEQPDFMRYEGHVDVNLRQPRGNPRQGGRYLFTYQRFDDLDRNAIRSSAPKPTSSNTSRCCDTGVCWRCGRGRRYQTPTKARRCRSITCGRLVGRTTSAAFIATAFATSTHCCCRPSIAGRSLRAVDGALFYDTGKVASRVENLNLKDLESDYGVGFRFGTANNVFLRIEAALGSHGGKHFIFSFHNVF